MIKGNGQVLQTNVDIAKEIKVFYINLIGSPHDEIDKIDLGIMWQGLQLTTLAAVFLTKFFTREEVKVSLFGIDDNKSLGFHILWTIGMFLEIRYWM